MGEKPYDSFSADGDENRIMVVIDNHNSRTAAVGGAVVRYEFVNGRKEKCAYLTGLKIHPDYKRKISFIAKAYAFLRNGISDCPYSYTTILDDNKEAISLFEKQHKNMPVYKYLGHYTTYCFHGGKKIIPITSSIISAEKANPLTDTSSVELKTIMTKPSSIKNSMAP